MFGGGGGGDGGVEIVREVADCDDGVEGCEGELAESRAEDTGAEVAGRGEGGGRVVEVEIWFVGLRRGDGEDFIEEGGEED